MRINWKYWVSQLWNGPSRLGDKYNISWLTYNPGVFLEFSFVARRNAPFFTRALIETFPHAKAFADVGCGTGEYSKLLQKEADVVVSYEYSLIARMVGRVSGVPVLPFDLSRNDLFPKQYVDVAFTIEVAEHIPPLLSRDFVGFLVSSAPIIVFTAARPGQPGHGHINCQPKEFWHDLFAERMYFPSAEHSSRMVRLMDGPRLSSFLRSNLTVYVKR